MEYLPQIQSWIDDYLHPKLTRNSAKINMKHMKADEKEGKSNMMKYPASIALTQVRVDRKFSENAFSSKSINFFEALDKGIVTSMRLAATLEAARD